MQINSLLKNGFSQEIYKGLKIFTKEESGKHYLKVFKDTASEPLCYYSSNKLETIQRQINSYKESYDRKEKYKEELKANPNKSSAANTATAIREELKKNFPDVKFSVKSSNFSGGDSVRIGWTDGPTVENVNSITNKYQYGSFNGMEDIYEYSNVNKDLPQSKYVQTDRTISDEVSKIVFDALSNIYTEDTDYELQRMQYRILSKNNIPVGSVVIGLKSNNECGLIEDVYSLDFGQTDEQLKEKIETKVGEVQIIEYSEKSIAVIGDTKPIKEKLKELGGKFNFRLTCGAGWIFPKTKLPEIEKIFS